VSRFLQVELSGLSALLGELGDLVDAATRPAAQAASQVLYDEVDRNVAAIGHKTGNLANAVYQVFSKDNSGPNRATYHISWNHSKAPHGQLLEFGHIQRYASYVGKDGNWYTAVRPEMQGKPKPGRLASEAEKDAYYVPRPGGPVHWVGYAFVRRATVKFPEAQEAAKSVLVRALNGSSNQA
jgi:hypothetical protein